MLCPRCRIPLLTRPHSAGLAWNCRRCAGQSLNFSQFRKLLPRLQANEVWLTVQEQRVIPQRRAFCPECGEAMAAVLVPLEAAGMVELDICPPCQRLWMDAPARQLAEGSLALGLRGEELPVVRMEGRRPERRARRKGEMEDDAPESPAILVWLRDLVRRGGEMAGGIWRRLSGDKKVESFRNGRQPGAD